MSASQLRIEAELEKQVEATLDEVQKLEYFVNQQTDTIQRHTDQSKIHTIAMMLFELRTERSHIRV